MPANERRFRHILCAVDFSPGARAALLAAAALAKRFDSALTLVHVTQPPWLGFRDSREAAPLHTSTADLVSQELAEWALEAGRRAERHVDAVPLDGTPWARIVEHARTAGVDLVVMGTHGRSGLAHALIGSVAERVARHAPCAVMIVRPPAATS